MSEERTVVENKVVTVVITTFSDGLEEAKAFLDGVGISADEAYGLFEDWENDPALFCKDAIGDTL